MDAEKRQAGMGQLLVIQFEFWRAHESRMMGATTLDSVDKLLKFYGCRS